MEYTILLMVLYLISNVVTVKTKRPSVLNLHSFMTDEEMAHYLETKSRDDIPEYDVIKLSRHRTKRSTHQDEDNRIYKISAFGKDLKLDVRRTTSTISPSGIVVHRRTLDGRLEKEIFKPEGKFFHGHVASNPGSRVALREIGDKGELSGAIFSGDHVYKLEPINANLKQKVDLHEEGHHVVSRRSISQRSSGLMEPILAQGISKDNLHQSKRNVMSSLKPKIVELMITVDNSSYDFHGNGTMDFVINVANMLNRLYRDVSMGFDISIALTKVFVIQGFEPGLDYQINQVTNAVKYLGTFSTWGAKQGSKFPTAAPGHFDNGALLTRRICGLNSCRLDGVAYSGYPCNPNLGFSVNDDTGLQVAFTIAHEMGHNLGMGHDNKTCFKGYIMSAGQQFGPNAFKWSHCSAQELRKALSRVKCYDDQPATAIPISSKYPPGYIFDMDKQCKKAFGPLVSQCPVTKENCGLLFCLEGSRCRSHTTPPLDGTPCGKRKWCMRGNCVDVGNDLPPAVDGQWSDWKAYGACSRSCGGGIRYKMRYCNNPSPQFFGKHCVGLDRGGEQICNPQECPTPSDPRTEQCKKQGSSASYYHSGSPCTLYCVYGSIARGHGPVADGTRCYQDADRKDICVRGKCRRAGCDNVLESENPYDRCQKCAGNGNECKRIILPDYIKDYRVYGPGKPDVMFAIPVGATSVMIKELQKTYNVLGLKVDPHQQPYVFPVPSYTGTYKAAGTVIQHYMASFSSEEWIYIRGPTTIKLYAMFVYAGFHINQGVSCQYYIPGKANSTQYVWKVVRGAKCNADCAGGKLHHIVTCHRQDDGTAVGTRFCDQNTKPPSREACNTQACTPIWKTEEWNMCSKSCGGGQQTRSVKCEQKVTQTTYKMLPISSCSAPQPTTVRSCHNHECPPYWEKGSWSKCSAECGGGTKSRTVTCEQTLLNSSTIALDDQRCLTDVGRKPAEREDCNTMDCYVWDAKYSCKVCTATKGYYHLGCYGDSRSRALPKLLSAYLQGDKIDSCYKMAKSQGYNIFGVQNNGECWTSTTGMDTYNKHGPSNKCQNNFGGPWANDVYEIVHEKDFAPIGCFNDRHHRKRPLPSFVANLRDKIDWKDMSKTVNECAEDAWQDGFPVFGVQYYGECWSGPLGHKSYDIDGPSLQGCWEGVGRKRANYVYAFSRRVVRPTVTCRHVVSNVKVPDNRCTSIKPEYEMQLCSHVCGNRQ